MGGEGKTVEADDMELGKSPKTRRAPDGRKSKSKVLSLIERGGPIRSWSSTIAASAACFTDI